MQQFCSIFEVEVTEDGAILMIRWKLDRGVTHQNIQMDREDVMEHLYGGAKLVE